MRVDAARTRVAQLQAALTKARQELAFAHDRALAASFSQLNAGSTTAPAYSGQYVFPVGGGPSVVSVSHHHHDYPAADIAAPEGSPISNTKPGGLRVEMTLEQACPPEYWRAQCAFKDSMIH